MKSFKLTLPCTLSLLNLLIKASISFLSLLAVGSPSWSIAYYTSEAVMWPLESQSIWSNALRFVHCPFCIPTACKVSLSLMLCSYRICSTVDSTSRARLRTRLKTSRVSTVIVVISATYAPIAFSRRDLRSKSSRSTGLDGNRAF